MHKFPITDYKKFSDLPWDRFNTLKFSIYILDFNWNYLFLNNFAKQYLGERGADLIGKNMWEAFPELISDPSFMLLRNNTEKRITTNIIAVSPLNGKRLNIAGYALEDCYYFSASILPDKNDLLNELRIAIGKTKNI